MTLEKRIRSCEHLTPAESEIANYILNHPEELLHLSIQELSNMVYISKSAILRFCKKVGCKGFNDLKVRLAKDLADVQKSEALIDVNYPFDESDSASEIAHKIQELYLTTIQDTLSCLDPQVLDQAAKILRKAKIIDLYTHAHNTGIAENFQDKLMTIKKQVTCPPSFYSQRLTALACDESHAALLLSYSGKASFLLPILQKLDEKRVPVILVSKIGCNFYPQYVKCHIALSNNEQLRDRISQFSSHIAMQYAMDVLYSVLYNMDRKEHQKYLSDSIDYMDDRKL